MKGRLEGDFSRFPSPRRKRYDAVWLQQGRVLLDADWNAQVEIEREQLRSQARDLIGPDGAPANDAGFAILPKSVLLFDGHRHHVTLAGAAIAALVGEARFTLEARVSPRPGGHGGTVLSRAVRRGDGGELLPDFRLAIRSDGGLVLESSGGSAPSLEGNVPVVFGRLNHLALSVDDEAVALYVNGELAALGERRISLTETAAGFLIGAGHRRAGVGEGSEGLEHFLDGIVYDVRMWSVALSAQTLRGIWQDVPAETEGLAGYWRFHDRSGSHVEDAAGHNEAAHLGGGDPTRCPLWVLRDLLIRRGRYYVDGVPCVNEETVPFGSQPDFPGARRPTRADGEAFLLYLDSWERFVSAVADPSLREVALGGPDTTARSQVVAQVKALPVDGVGAGGERWREEVQRTWESFLGRQGRHGRLEARRRPDSATLLGNLLYRVEIHSPGGVAGRTPEEDAASSGVDAVGWEATLELEAEPWETEAGFWPVGQVVEVRGHGVQGHGTLAEVRASDRERRTITLNTVLPELADRTRVRVRRIATFKWSRDNGSTLLPIAHIEGESGVVELQLPGERGLELAVGDWVEVSDDHSELLGAPAPLSQVTSIDAGQPRISLEPHPPAGIGRDPALHPRLRRWDQHGPELVGGAVVAGAGDWMELEAGIEVRFDGEAHYAAGDYWWMPARTATEDIEWPRRNGEALAVPPVGVGHRYAQLAFLRFEPTGFQLEDLRKTFEPVTQGAVRKEGDEMYGPLSVRSDVAVEGTVTAGAVEARRLSGDLATPGSVRTANLTDGAVTVEKLDPAIGTVPADGVILAAAGQALPGYVATGCELTLPVPEARWRATAELSPELTGPLRSAAAGGRIFTFTETGETWETDPAGGRMHRRASMPQSRRDFAVATAHGKIYVLGGREGDRITGGTLEYDPGTDRWSEKRGMPTPRAALAAAEVGGKIFAIGGLRPFLFAERPTGSTEVYDPLTNHWSRRRPLPSARWSLGAAGSGGKVHAFGGRRRFLWGLVGPAVSSAHQVLHASTNRWENAAPLPTPRSSMGVAAAGGKIYAVGGEGLMDPTGDTEIYDPATDAWVWGEPLPTPAAAPAVAAVDGTLYVVGVPPQADARSRVVEELAVSRRFSLQRRLAETAGGVPEPKTAPEPGPEPERPPLDPEAAGPHGGEALLELDEDLLRPPEGSD